jgi:hypothetical protein
MTSIFASSNIGALQTPSHNLQIRKTTINENPYEERKNKTKEEK